MARQEILNEAARKFPKAKMNAVGNFTLGKEGKGMNMEYYINLKSDAKSYGWNSQTVRAIEFVIG